MIQLISQGKKMSLSSFYKCSFFEETVESVEKTFSVFQKEIILKNYIDGGKASFEKRDIEYCCKWNQQSDWDTQRPSILVPIRDNLKLLTVTIENFFDNKINKKANIIIIDDRSKTDIETLAIESGFSYLRIDNEKGFNFSMLNNIAAKISHSLGTKEIILWNSDLWCVKEEYFDILLKRHRDNKSKISGSKLVYPPKEMSLNEDVDTENIKKTFPNMVGKEWRNTVQFGGSYFYGTPNSPISNSPLHYKRFSDPQDPRVNCDRGISFVTGALQIWDVEYFIEIGGLNPSMSRNFQDVDICLRSCMLGHIPMYFGKDIYFYHDESANFYSNTEEKKFDGQMVNDHVLFGKLWNEKVPEIMS